MSHARLRGCVLAWLLVPGADHLPVHLDSALERRDGMSVAQQAVRFFGLER